MDEGKFAADFIAANLEKIWKIGESAYESLDDSIKLKLKLSYSEYLKNTKEKYSKAKSFFIRNQSIDLYSYYVATGISSGRKTISTPKFRTCLDASNRIVITGTGGSGKSVLMRHLFLDCIHQKQYVPLLIELRDLNANQMTLEEHILETLETYGFSAQEKYIAKAKKEGHFCFFLDGYDEIDYSLRKTLIKQIKSISNKYKKCPIFLSSRPDDIFNGIDDFAIFEINKLDITSATSLIQKLPFDTDIKGKFIADLESGLFKKHQSFLSNPLLLSIMLLTYGENAEIPSKLSIFYNQAYEALFQRHDANKGGYSRTRKSGLDIQDFSRVFSLFALQTYERRLIKVPRTSCLSFIEKSKSALHKDFQPEDYLHDLLSAACLLVEDGLDIAFSHRSFQEYFVAIYISSATPEAQNKLIERYSNNIISDNVIKLLLEINPELIERHLIIPTLSEAFRDINIRKNVGVTHATKYMKKVYKTLNIEEESFTATLTEKGLKISECAHMAIRICENFRFPSESYFINYRKQMWDKYGENSQRTELSLNKLTHKSPILTDTLKGLGGFSTCYIQAVYDAYRKIEKKHSNIDRELDSLLGI